MNIPVFVSCPTILRPDQLEAKTKIDDFLKEFELEGRALGVADYPTELPLREVLVIAKHCSGGIILGFEQVRATEGNVKMGTSKEQVITAAKPKIYPTEWNNLEAGIIFGLGLPLLVFKEDGVEGGVFDNGVTDVFVHTLPIGSWTPQATKGIRKVFLKWQAKVRERYYSI